MAYLKALAAPFGGVRFVPTGGIGPDNLAAYLAVKQVIACGGSWMVKKALIAAGEFDTIRALAAQAREIACAARPDRGVGRRETWAPRVSRRRPVPLGPRGPRRGHAAPRPRRGPHRDDALVQVCEGGGEYNVARGLRRCFGLRTALVSALADNPVGHLIEELILRGGVDQSHLRWVPYDGVGRGARNGLNFTERGFGVRGAVGCSDRGHTAVSQLRPGEFDWDADLWRRGRALVPLRRHLRGARRAHRRGGHRGDVRRPASRHHRLLRPQLPASLWRSIGGQDRAREVNRAVAPLVDVMLGNEEDFSAALGFEVAGVDRDLSALDPERFGAMMAQVVAAYPNIRVVATTLRAVVSASRNDWSAVCWADGALHRSLLRPSLEILDRVGGGDSFASGLIYGLLSGLDLQQALEYGAAHGALAMTTPGDTSMATFAEVEGLVRGVSARVQR